MLPYAMNTCVHGRAHPPAIEGMISPNQVLTHAARAAAKQLNKVAFQPPLVAARGAREGLWLEQSRGVKRQDQSKSLLF